MGRTDQVGARVQVEATEVLGQKKLLKWSVPGVAHVFVFFGFLILTLTVIEAFGELFIAGFAFPIIGTWPIVRFLEDLFAVLVLVGILVFAVIRFRNNPAKEGRWSRFFGSHTSGAWLVLFMIFMVVVDAAVLPRRQDATPTAPTAMDGAFASHVGRQPSSSRSARPPTTGC